MSRRTWVYDELDDDLPVRDRPYESFGQQGLALPTYGDPRTRAWGDPGEERDSYEYERSAEEADASGVHRGAERVDLGEPLDPRPSGPKGWKRRDDRIHDDLCARLTDDSHVDATDLEVIVHDGVVTLAGRVPDRAQRERAYEIAARVRGVVDVIRRLRALER